MRGSVIIVLCLTIALVIAGCKPGVPRDVIQPDEMEAILYDYYLSQALAAHVSEDKRATFEKNAYYHAVLKKHGVTEAQFDSSLVYYYTHAEDFNDIYKNVVLRMEGEATGMGASIVSATTDDYSDENGDTFNIWTDGTSTILMPIPLYNRFNFAIECDSTYVLGDSFEMSFFSTFVYQSGTKDGILYIIVYYEGDSLTTFQKQLNRTGTNTLHIDANDKVKPRLIKGFIYLSRGNDDSETTKLLFIDNIRLLRYHPLEPIIIKEDSVGVDSLGVDSLGVDSLVVDSLKRDSLLRDSLRRDSSMIVTKAKKTNARKTSRRTRSDLAE